MVASTDATLEAEARRTLRSCETGTASSTPYVVTVWCGRCGWAMPPFQTHDCRWSDGYVPVTGGSP